MGVEEAHRKLSMELSRAPTENEMAAALPSLGELRYIRRFLDEVSAIEDELAA